MGLIFDSIITDLLAVLGLFIAILYGYFYHVFGYWERRGVKFYKPMIPFGNFGPTAMQQKSIGELVLQLHNDTTEPFIGVFGFNRPILLVREPELIRTILIKDFSNFVNRGIPVNEVHDPLSGSLFGISGDRWRYVRNQLSPVFTSGKLKAMFQTLVDCGVPLEKFIEKAVETGEIIEAREMAARFTTNIIASVAFGHEIDCFADPNNPFRYYGRKAFELSLSNSLRFFTQFILPKVHIFLRIKVVANDVENFILSMVRQTLEYREKNNVSRKDLFQLLLRLRNTGNVEDNDEHSPLNKNENKKLMSITEMSAQAWAFYAAGFETSSTTLSFCLYELARQPEIQLKIQNEIDAVLARHNGQYTYDSLTEMRYLGRVIDETLRKYPALPFLNRQCSKTYKLPDTDITIEEGVAVMISILGFHMNPKYYENPEKFDPDRFLGESLSFIERPYFPFGDGPRNCIGTRLAKMQVKIGLAVMLHKYNYDLAPNMIGELKMSAQSPLMAPEGGIHLTIRRRMYSE